MRRWLYDVGLAREGEPCARTAADCGIMSLMTNQADNPNAQLLDILQRDVPMVERPFAAIGETMGLSEDDIIARVTRLRDEGVIRQISAIFDSHSIGYTSALVAFAVQGAHLDAVGASVAALSSVSHCYSRAHRLNLWFTVTVPPGRSVSEEVDPLTRLDGVEQAILLPALRVFKVGVFLRMTDEGDAPAAPTQASERRILDLTDEDRAAVRALQKDLPAIPRPFDILAQGAGTTTEDLLARARSFIECGAMRRFAAVLRHRHAGYTANAMVCWLADPDRIEDTGLALASHPAVSHCYQRRTYPDWPYSLYTMLHARSEDRLRELIRELTDRVPDTPFAILTTLKEYKKSRVQYFTD